MTYITLQEMYDEWKKAANGIGTPSDSAQPDPTQAATIIAALKGQLERLGDLLEQMQGNGTGAMPVQLTGSIVADRKTTANAVTVDPGMTANLEEYSVEEYREFDFLIVVGSTNLNPGSDFAVIANFTYTGLSYASTDGGINFEVSCQVDNVTPTGTKRSIVPLNRGRVPLYCELFRLQFQNKTANTIQIRNRTVRRFK